MLNRKKSIDHKTALVFGDIFQDLSDESFVLKSGSYLARAGLENSWFEEKRCLDAGCGAGIAADALSRIKGTRVYAVDFSKPCLALARKRLSNFGNCSLWEASLLELPFKNDSFDFVNCNSVLHHLTNPLKALSELSRVLSSSGWLFLGVYGAGGLANEYRINMGRFLAKTVPYSLMKKILPPKQRAQILNYWYVPVRRPYREALIREMLASCGFQNITRLSSGFYRKPVSYFEKIKLGPDGMYMHFLAQKRSTFV